MRPYAPPPKKKLKIWAKLWVGEISGMSSSSPADQCSLPIQYSPDINSLLSKLDFW